MDMITLAMAKAYTDSQRLGYTSESLSTPLGDSGTAVIQNFEASEDMGGMGLFQYDHAFGSPNNIRWEVIWDGVKYICPVNPNPDAFMVGNLSLFDQDSEDTGEPFVFGIDFNQNVTLMIAKEPGEHGFWFDIYSETIHPIDPKFLPPMGGGLPVVELSTVIVANPDLSSTALTAEESSKLDVVNGEPCIIKFKLNMEGLTVDASAFAMYVNQGGLVSMYAIVIASMGQLTIVKDVEGWSYQFALNG